MSVINLSVSIVSTVINTYIDILPRAAVLSNTSYSIIPYTGSFYPQTPSAYGADWTMDDTWDPDVPFYRPV